VSATLTPPPEAPERAPATPALDRVVVAARRRMRLNRTLSLAGPVVATAAGVVVAWLLVGRLVVLPAVDGWVALAAAVGALGVLVWGATTRIPDAWAAWAADRWLGTRDAFATAVELTSGVHAGSLDAGQVAAAEERATGFRGWPERPRVPQRPLAVAAALVLLAALLAWLPNPQDEVRAQRAAERAAIEAEAEAVRELAEELATSPDPELQAAAEELEELADELLEAEDAAQALEDLEAARAELARQLEDDQATQRTALTGLARELGEDPLAAGDTVRSQLDALAEALAAGQPTDPAEQQTLAERLSELADALAAGQPDLSDALRAASGALSRGDTGAAADAVARASGEVGEALRGLANQEALGSAVGALDDAARALRDAQQGTGSGQGSGQGQGSGEGQASGQGSGEGSGQGSGDGQGSGEGSGEGSGSGSGQGQGSGQGSGQASGGGGGGNPTGSQGQGGSNTGGTGNAGGHSSPDTETVYDPTRVGGDGEDLHLGGQDSGQGGESTVGQREGQGIANDSLVPYRDVLADYLDIATRTIERPGYPVELRDLVRTYFDTLSRTPGSP
jgi:hypothetical protein